MTLTKKSLAEIQIATKLDDFYYELDANKYFNSMKSMVLAESQLMNVNHYIEMLRSSDDEKAQELRTIFYEVQAYVVQFESKISKGDRTYNTYKLHEYATYLVRQINKHIKQYKTVKED